MTLDEWIKHEKGMCDARWVKAKLARLKFNQYTVNKVKEKFPDAEISRNGLSTDEHVETFIGEYYASKALDQWLRQQTRYVKCKRYSGWDFIVEDRPRKEFFEWVSRQRFVPLYYFWEFDFGNEECLFLDDEYQRLRNKSESLRYEVCTREGSLRCAGYFLENGNEVFKKDFDEILQEYNDQMASA